MIITWKEILSQTADGPTWRRTPSCCRTPSSYGRTWRRRRPRCPRRCPPPTCCTAPRCRCPGSGSWTRGSCAEDVHGDLRCQSPASPDIPAIKIKILKPSHFTWCKSASHVALLSRDMVPTEGQYVAPPPAHTMLSSRPS